VRRLSLTDAGESCDGSPTGSIETPAPASALIVRENQKSISRARSSDMERARSKSLSHRLRLSFDSPSVTMFLSHVIEDRI
jgi:hypothetical protein